jgi:hypothetical protein
MVSANPYRSRNWGSTCPGRLGVVEWREGSNDGLNGRFARVRVHAAHRDNLLQ